MSSKFRDNKILLIISVRFLMITMEKDTHYMRNFYHVFYDFSTIFNHKLQVSRRLFEWWPLTGASTSSVTSARTVDSSCPREMRATAATP